MKKNNKKGFTLVELVIVVAVMAILVAVAIPTIGAVTSKAKASVYDSNAKTIESMLKLEEANADDGSATSTPDYKKALEDANLGIKNDTFYVDPGTNNVLTSTENKIPTAAADPYTATIKFETKTVSGATTTTITLTGFGS